MDNSENSKGYILPPLKFKLNKVDKGCMAKLKCSYVSLEQRLIKDILCEIEDSKEFFTPIFDNS